LTLHAQPVQCLELQKKFKRLNSTAGDAGWLERFVIDRYYGNAPKYGKARQVKSKNKKGLQIFVTLSVYFALLNTLILLRQKTDNIF